VNAGQLDPGLDGEVGKRVGQQRPQVLGTEELPARRRFGDGDLLVRVWVHVGREKTMGTFFDWQSPDLSAPVGSVELEKILRDGVAELAQGLKQGVEAFVDHLPADEDSG
jgi:hypothetical protein